MRFNLSIANSIVNGSAIVGGIVGTVQWYDHLGTKLDRIEDRLQNTRDRLYVIQFPDDPWSIDYVKTHQKYFAPF